MLRQIEMLLARTKVQNIITEDHPIQEEALSIFLIDRVHPFVTFLLV